MSDVIFSWEIPHWTLAPDNKRTNIPSGTVMSVAWRLTATDPESGESKTVFSTAALPPPDGEKTFIPKDHITKDMIIEWIKPVMGYDAYVEQLTNFLRNQTQPIPTVEVPPFSAPAPKKQDS